MSPKVRLNQRMRVILNMVTAFVVMILLTQLWLFSVAVDAAPKIAAASSSNILTSFAISASTNYVRSRETHSLSKCSSGRGEARGARSTARET